MWVLTKMVLQGNLRQMGVHPGAVDARELEGMTVEEAALYLRAADSGNPGGKKR